MPSAPGLARLLVPGAVDQDPSHRLGSGREEVAATVPVLGLLYVHEPDVRFMNQGRGLKRLPGLLLRQLLGRELTQLVVDQWQELLCGVRIAVLDGGQDVGDVAHGVGSRSGEGRLLSILPGDFAVAIKCQAWISASVATNQALSPRVI